MDNAPVTKTQVEKQWQGILDAAIAVITKPAEFYRGMVKSGGFVDPLIFLGVMGVIGGVIQALLGLLHITMAISVGTALKSIVVMPIAIIIGSFIGAAILFVIWKLMGSNESYETAYRCGAYSSATIPIMAILGVIPFVGGLIGLAWMLFLLVNASVEVHKIAAKTAWMVFGTITATFAAILLLISACGRIVGRHAQKMGFGEAYGTPGQEMTPEEAGKAATAAMKAFQEEMTKQAAEAKKQAEENQ